jgi:hypothetical protein
MLFCCSQVNAVWENCAWSWVAGGKTLGALKAIVVLEFTGNNWTTKPDKFGNGDTDDNCYTNLRLVLTIVFMTLFRFPPYLAGLFGRPVKSGCAVQIISILWVAENEVNQSLQVPSGDAVDWGTVLQTGKPRVRFPIVSLEFFIDIILLVTLWPWGWLSL